MLRSDLGSQKSLTPHLVFVETNMVLVNTNSGIIEVEGRILVKDARYQMPQLSILSLKFGGKKMYCH